MASIRGWQYHVCDIQQSDLTFLVYVGEVSIPLGWMPAECRAFVDNRTFWSCLLSNNLIRQQSSSDLVSLLRQEHRQRLRSIGNGSGHGFGRDQHSWPRQQDPIWIRTRSSHCFDSAELFSSNANDTDTMKVDRVASILVTLSSVSLGFYHRTKRTYFADSTLSRNRQTYTSRRYSSYLCPCLIIEGSFGSVKWSLSV